jgi:hypothetical protein
VAALPATGPTAPAEIASAPANAPLVAQASKTTAKKPHVASPGGKRAILAKHDSKSRQPKNDIDRLLGL